MPYTYGRTLLKINDVSLSYEGRPVLKNVCAEIRDILSTDSVTGQVVGFLGPSGVGKTSLFRIIAGLIPPTAGTVTLDGDVPVHPGLVGVVAQNYPLFQHRTVYSNLMLAARSKLKTDNEARDKVNEMTAYMGLEQAHGLYPSQLSGGQRQRVSILQQILCSFHFILMDEPFSGLDMLMLEKTCELIRSVADMDDLNTIIVVSHDVTSAAAVSDILWLMGRDRDANGKIVPGARIMQTYNMLERGLHWRPGIVTEQAFVETVRDIKVRFRNL